MHSRPNVIYTKTLPLLPLFSLLSAPSFYFFFLLLHNRTDDYFRALLSVVHLEHVIDVCGGLWAVPRASGSADVRIQQRYDVLGGCVCCVCVCVCVLMCMDGVVGRL